MMLFLPSIFIVAALGFVDDVKSYAFDLNILTDK